MDVTGKICLSLKMKLEYTDVCAIIDTREQKPLRLTLANERGTLPTGDYSLKGMEEIMVVERKELSDLIGCMTTGRERFEKELMRMKAYSHKCVVVEGLWSDLENGNYRSQIKPKSATHTVISWMSRFGVPFAFVGSRESAAAFVDFFLFSTARRMHDNMERLFND